MIKKIALVVLIVNYILVAGCADTCSCKKIACPEYHDLLADKWIPFDNNQQIIFKTLSGKTDTVPIGLVIRSGSYEANQGCARAAKGCEQQFTVYSPGTDGTGNTKFNISYYTLTSFTSSIVTKRLEWHFHQFYLTANDISEQGLLLDPGQGIQSQQVSTVNLNGITFSDLQVLQKDTINVKNAGPFKLYLAKNTGLVAYETYPGGELWLRQ